MNVGYSLAAPYELRRWGWSGGKSSTRRTLKCYSYEAANCGAHVPSESKPGAWQGGEMLDWLRVAGAPGRSEWLAVIMPYPHGNEAPEIERLSATSFRVRLGDEQEVVHLDFDGSPQAALIRMGAGAVLLAPGEIPSWSTLEFDEQVPRNERVRQQD
ncbi:MAG: hypothetical protein AAF961_02430 [Planctomycetota bacterium]